MNSFYNLEKIDIRSKKIHKIMKEEPAWIVRYGTSIIATILLIAAIILYSKGWLAS